jgi:type VI secretion system protein ImpA
VSEIALDKPKHILSAGGRIIASMIEAEELLKPISDESPCGEDLSYDPSFQELESLARGKEETQFSAAEPPDWKALRSRCLELFARSKDLRVAMTLAIAFLELDGLRGFRESLSLVKGLIERYWPIVYPQLDPADDNDPLQRMNIFASMAMPVGTYGDSFRILERLRRIPLCDSVQMGRFCLADILRAETGGPSPDNKPEVKMAQIDSAFRDSNQEKLGEIFQILSDCINLVQGIDELLTLTVGAKQAPDLTPLSSELSSMRSRVAPFIKAGAVSVVGGEIGSTAGSSEAAGRPALSLEGEIRSREDVLGLLQKICQFYERIEPSSPVPLVLKRAARLAEMDFMQIMQDLSPDAISQIRIITGEKEAEEG